MSYEGKTPEPSVCQLKPDPSQLEGLESILQTQGDRSRVRPLQRSQHHGKGRLGAQERVTVMAAAKSENGQIWELTG